MVTLPNQTQRRHPSSAAGFSLIELLIVVAIILVIAAIAIPNFIRSRMAANEAAAVSGLRNLSTAEVVYSTTYGLGYAASLATLGPPAGGGPPGPTAAELIDVIMAAGTKSGYVYTYTAGAPDATGKINDYQINADPLQVGATGTRHFFVDESGIIRQNLAGKAGITDPPIL
jgi:type IV pilus assembly protein PilA